MKNIILILLFILIGSSSSDNNNLIYMNCLNVYDYNLSIGYQRIIFNKNAIGLLVECKSYKFNQIDIIGTYFNYNFYLKDNFRGLWIDAQVGVESYYKRIEIPIVPGVGYNWVTPIGISLGFNLGIGPIIKRYIKNDNHWRFIGIAHLGYCF